MLIYLHFIEGIPHCGGVRDKPFILIGLLGVLYWLEKQTWPHRGVVFTLIDHCPPHRLQVSAKTLFPQTVTSIGTKDENLI